MIDRVDSPPGHPGPNELVPTRKPIPPSDVPSGIRASSERATAEAAAATAILLDPTAWPVSAVLHLLAGWDALADAATVSAGEPSGDAVAVATAPDSVAVHVRAAKLPGLSETARADIAAALERLEGGGGAMDVAVDVGQLRRLALELQRCARRLGRQGRPWQRSRRLWAGGSVLGLAIAALIYGGVVSFGGHTGHGWLGRYYARPQFQGEPVVRDDPSINFDWLAAAPMAGLPRDHFSVRWDSCLTLPADETLSIRVGSDDGSRVFVDGRRVLDNWHDQAGNWSTWKAPLGGGVHHLRVDYYEDGGNALAIAELRTDHGPVPESWLRLPRRRGRAVSCAGE